MMACPDRIEKGHDSTAKYEETCNNALLVKPDG